MKFDTPLVSVLMTTYNRERYLSCAIESILQSTLQDIELIIVDDGSNDKTVSIANSYTEKDVRVKVFQNEQNLGDYSNRNMASNFASGKYLKYVDADDYIYPWGLERMVEIMEAFPKAGWGLCSLPQYNKKPFPFMLSSKEAYEYHYFGPGLFHKAPLSSIIKKDLFAEVKGFEPMRMVGDFAMWHKLARISPVVLMPDGIVWYREHDQQEMNSHAKFAYNYEEVIVDALNYSECPLTYEQVEEVFKTKRALLLKRFFKNLVKLNRTEIESQFKMWKLYSLEKKLS